MLKIILLSSLFLFSSCSFYPGQLKHLASPDIYLIRAQSGFTLLYDSGATKTIKDYYESGSVVLNGSYFGTTKSGVYYPAGYWKVPGQTINLKTIGIDSNILYDDPNITHFIAVSSEGVEIFPNSEFRENTGAYDLIFQAGPLVLSGNLLQNFGKSWHAHEPHERTLIGRTESGKIYFLVFSKPITLDDVGMRISHMDIFQNDPITLLNMDGGPSTSYYDGVNGFNVDAKLPIMIVLRK